MMLNGSWIPPYPRERSAPKPRPAQGPWPGLPERLQAVVPAGEQIIKVILMKCPPSVRIGSHEWEDDENRRRGKT